jgi:hypothetical protein
VNRTRNTVDQVSATLKCIANPMSAVRVPPINALGPSSVDATPWKSRVTVEP